MVRDTGWRLKSTRYLIPHMDTVNGPYTVNVREKCNQGTEVLIQIQKWFQNKLDYGILYRYLTEQGYGLGVHTRYCLIPSSFTGTEVQILNQIGHELNRPTTVPSFINGTDFSAEVCVTLEN